MVGPKTRASWTQLVLGIVALGVIYLKYLMHTPSTDQALKAILWLLATSLVIDKIPLITSNSVAEKEAKDLELRLSQQQSRFVGHQDVLTFSNNADGLAYCLAVCPFAITVRNTIIRYGGNSDQQVTAIGETYPQWLDAKKKAIARGCGWTEIISARLKKELFTAGLVDADGRSVNGLYTVKCLDESKTPMIQMTIFKHTHGSKEIVFGWQFPGVTHGPCFLIRNLEIVDYFERYFDHLFTEYCFPYHQDKLGETKDSFLNPSPPPAPSR